MKNRIPGCALTLTLLMAFIIPSAASARRAPDWIDGASKKYSEPRYFIGVGAVPMGRGGKKQQLQMAGDRARGEIAKTLRAKVQVETRAERTVTGTQKGRGRKDTQSRSQMKDVVRTSTSEILDGVEIKQYYRDKKGKTLYALAILDRIKAARRLEDSVNIVKGELLAEMEIGESLQTEGRLLPAIGHYNNALGLAGQIRRTNELISVLKPAGPSPFASAANYETDIRRIISGIRKRIRFDISVTGPASKVRLYIIQGLAKAGYITKAGSATPGGTQTYHLECVTDLTYRGTIDMGKDMVMQIYQADLDIEIEDPRTKETVGMLTWSVSANEKTGTMAEKSAVRALGRFVKEQIADKMATLL